MKKLNKDSKYEDIRGYATFETKMGNVLNWKIVIDGPVRNIPELTCETAQAVGLDKAKAHTTHTCPPVFYRVALCCRKNPPMAPKARTKA